MLTVIILAHNKDDRFKTALESAKLADEVLVIEKKEAIKDFSKVRNEAMGKAKNDWVFFLDSDEVIPAKAWGLFEKVIKNGNFPAATVGRKDIFHGKELKFGETRDTRIVRLLNKNKAKFVRPVHEVVEVDGNIFDLDISIEHYAHKDVAEFLDDVSSYAEIEAEYREGKDEKEKIIFESIFFPVGKFILNYFFKLGFLDGWRGLVYATIMSLHSLFVRINLYANL